MTFTDRYIQRPVLATVISLLILMLGFIALQKLPLRQYPKVETGSLTITTAYPGASAEVVQGFITTPIQDAIAGVDGIDFISSSSSQGTSTVNVFLKAGVKVEGVQADLVGKVQTVKSLLPKNAEDPAVIDANQDATGLLYIAFSSEQITAAQITDYLTRTIKPKLQVLDGVASARILGSHEFAMRIWLDPRLMAAHYVSATDFANALRVANIQATAGSTKGKYDEIEIKAHTLLTTPEQFEQVPIRNDQGKIVYLKDIGKVELGAASYDSSVLANGKNAIVLQVVGKSTANPLTVATRVKQELHKMFKVLPPAMHGEVIYDVSRFIHESLSTVQHTIIEAVIIVLLVIFLFLGSARAVLIPVVTIPLSLIGVCMGLLFFGFSINVLTLLAMVLAIGLVVDDAIVVIENISRHLELGQTPMQASLQGAREIASPVISMTLTLAAVYLPIGFMGGLTGGLFTEFAFTLAGSVIVSGIVALTLSPMMCSKLLSQDVLHGKFYNQVSDTLTRLASSYRETLTRVLDSRGIILFLVMIVLGGCFFFFQSLQHELAPEEDQSVLMAMLSGPSGSNINYTESFAHRLASDFETIPEKETDIIINGMMGVNSAISFFVIKPKGERHRTQKAIQGDLMGKLNSITGMRASVFGFPTLPGTPFGLPIQFVLSSSGDYSQLNEVMSKLLMKANCSGKFIFAMSDLNIDKPELTVRIDQRKAADLGISNDAINDALGVLLSDGYLTRFSLAGRSYKVIPQVTAAYRHNPENVAYIQVRTASGRMVPLSNIVTLSKTVGQSELNQMQQQNSATFQALPMPGVSMSEVIDYLQTTANSLLPATMSYDYTGQTRQYIQEGNALLITFLFAVIIIYLVLSAQFESFRDPWIILISVPMSLFGALLPLMLASQFSGIAQGLAQASPTLAALLFPFDLGFATINIFTQIGFLTLVGLISKHGILIVQFANELQRTKGLSIREAVIEAATVRLRPILMTTAAMSLGVIPLIFSTAGLENSQRGIGIVILFGMIIGTCFTLFVVPSMYTYLAARHSEVPT